MTVCGCRVRRSGAGAGLVLFGLGLSGVGVWARREVRHGLERERISAGGEPVSSASAARALAETIRDQTLETTGGRTYAETDSYLAKDGSATPDVAGAALDESTGKPVRNPDVDLWLQATTLQTALMQAYLSFRLADLMVGLGGAFVLAGAAIGSSGRR